jgi:hypothetical protein
MSVFAALALWLKMNAEGDQRHLARSVRRTVGTRGPIGSRSSSRSVFLHRDTRSPGADFFFLEVDREATAPPLIQGIAGLSCAEHSAAGNPSGPADGDFVIVLSPRRN